MLPTTTNLLFIVHVIHLHEHLLDDGKHHGVGLVGMLLVHWMPLRDFVLKYWSDLSRALPEYSFSPYNQVLLGFCPYYEYCYLHLHYFCQIHLEYLLLFSFFQLDFPPFYPF
jgi:hypothetical protein